jgi:hypothetical protein
MPPNKEAKVFSVRSESKRLGPLSRLELIFLCCFAAFDASAAAMLYGSYREPNIPAPEIKSDWRPPVLDMAPPAQIKSAAADKETLTRPIFMKSRRPYVAKTSGAKSGSESAGGPTLPPGLALKAIVGQGRGKKRVFAVATAVRDGQWLKVGDVFEGWTLIAAQPLKVTFQHGDYVAEVAFDYALSATPPAEPARMVQARPQPFKGEGDALKPVGVIRNRAL